MDEPILVTKAALRRHPSMSGGERVLLVVRTPGKEGMPDQVQTLYLMVDQVQPGDGTRGVPEAATEAAAGREATAGSAAGATGSGGAA